jgi:hypothetical protein
MSVWDRLRELMGRAKEGATDLAQVANIKLDIRGLESRRDSLFREIGRQAYSMRAEGRGVPEFESACAEVAQLEQRIADKEKEMQAVRERGPAASPRGSASAPRM